MGGKTFVNYFTSGNAYGGLPTGREAGIHGPMRRLSLLLLMLICVMPARMLSAADGKVIKTLPMLLDTHDRDGLSPSLYERDAYQFWLRRHPAEQAGLGLEVQWKASGVDWSKVKLRAELRGVQGNSMTNITLEMPAKKTGWFSTWSEFKISGQDYQGFGRLVAWRVTLWEGETKLATQESFLWSGVGQKPD